MISNDLKTRAFVLRRTDYEEVDRIVTLLTKTGQKTVIAKGARKEKSKLAGGIEMFCLSDVVIHQGRGDLGVLTSAKMVEFYENIISDLDRIELGSKILKMVSKYEDPGYFNLVHQSLSAINKFHNLSIIEAWFLFNLAKISGDEVNLHYDNTGEKLKIDQVYNWNSIEQSLAPAVSGDIAAAEIKVMRLMVSADLHTVLRVENLTGMIEPILFIAKSINQL